MHLTLMYIFSWTKLQLLQDLGVGTTRGSQYLDSKAPEGPFKNEDYRY